MKKLVLILTVFLVNAKSLAQIPVTDVAANGNLALINSQLSAISAMIMEQNAVNLENKYENYAQKILGQNNLAFIQQVEDYMWRANDYLKKGREIQMIYNKEEQILKKLKDFKKTASKYGNLDGNTSLISSVDKNISTTLNSVGTLVDGAQAILGDNNIRMTTAERREILKETIGKLMIIENVLDNLNANNRRNSILLDQYYTTQEYQKGIDERMKSFLKKKK